MTSKRAMDVMRFEKKLPSSSLHPNYKYGAGKSSIFRALAGLW